MTKTNQTKKLALKTQAIRVLVSDELAGVQGGWLLRDLLPWNKPPMIVAGGFGSASGG